MRSELLEKRISAVRNICEIVAQAGIGRIGIKTPAEPSRPGRSAQTLSEGTAHRASARVLVQGGGIKDPGECRIGKSPFFIASVEVEFEIMPLASGARLGQYETLSPIGAGGMGEVYK